MLVIGLSGCVGEEIGCPPEPRADLPAPVTITVSIPGQRIPSGSRSIAGAGGEAVVKTIDVLVFKPGGSGNPEVLAGRAAGKISSQSASKDDEYEVRFTADLDAEPAATTLVILANVASSTLDAATAFVRKQDVLGALVHASSNASGTPDGWKWNAVSASDYTPIPMYGERPVGGITSGMLVENVALTRMLARIDVQNNASGFTLTGVYVVNYHTSGYIAPAWGTNGALEAALPAAPMIPDGASPRSGESNAMYYPVSGVSTLGEIYTYEAPAAADDALTDAVCLIIKGEYNAQDESYYRIDFTDDASGYMAVYRNHRYLFDISEVAGSGYGSFDEAFRSWGLTNNLKTRLHVVDQSGFLYLVFNGQYFIGVNSRLFPIHAAPASGFNLEVITNAGSLQATATEDWIILGTQQAGIGGRYTIPFTVEQNTENDERSGKIDLTSGRLRLSVDISQAIN